MRGNDLEVMTTTQQAGKAGTLLRRFFELISGDYTFYDDEHPPVASYLANKKREPGLPFRLPIDRCQIGGCSQNPMTPGLIGQHPRLLSASPLRCQD